eukprot:TRINITY_DN25906_c0_g1_i1.p1 TRINITY_DN25906_c0_g1~~TRINITY_DN25906_c0_g1_i1.p1  ORF type:complete len:476 (+),score=79.17 TRINITY_DN25906_c0_g1_i1:173-1600(+)
MSEQRMLEDAQRAEHIRQVFRTWDEDGNGYISKAELRFVLIRLTPGFEHLSVEDIDLLMQDADRNGNGRIEYDEFVAWLSRPGAGISLTGGGTVELFDLEKVLRPLFQVYDRNGDGSITGSEFEECHNILQSALTLHPVGAKSATVPKEPEEILSPASVVFSTIDRDVDGRIAFHEFVRWQRIALEKSGLLNEDLVNLVPALARQLKRVFNFADSNENKPLTEIDEKVLMRVTENIANFTRDLLDKEELGHNTLRGRHHFTNRWSEPPIGLNVHRLKAMHLKTMPFPQWGVEKVDLLAFCVPEHQDPGAYGDQPNRRWFARLTQRATFKQGRTEFDEPHYYVYEKLSWIATDGSAMAFDESAELLPPELRVFCLLKAEANFGIQITWAGIQFALEHAIVLGILTEAQRQQYNAIVDTQLLKTLNESEETSEASSEIETLRRLHEHLVLSPRDVMAALTQAGIVRMSSVWADVLKS